MARKNKTDKRENTLLIIAFLVLLLLSSLWLYSLGFGYMGGMMFFGPIIFMILVLVLIVWLIVSLIRAGDNK